MIILLQLSDFIYLCENEMLPKSNYLDPFRNLKRLATPILRPAARCLTQVLLSFSPAPISNEDGRHGLVNRVSS